MNLYYATARSGGCWPVVLILVLLGAAGVRESVAAVVLSATCVNAFVNNGPSVGCNETTPPHPLSGDTATGVVSVNLDGYALRAFSTATASPLGGSALNAAAFLRDQITVVGDIGPGGAVIELNYLLTGRFSGVGNGPGQAALGDISVIDGLGNAHSARSTLTYDGFSVGHDTSFSQGTFDHEIVSLIPGDVELLLSVFATVTDSLRVVDVFLNLQATASPAAFGATTSDFADTARLFAGPLRAGLSLITESGFEIPFLQRAVPGAPTAPLLLTGLAVLLFQGRSRAARHVG